MFQSRDILLFMILSAVLPVVRGVEIEQRGGDWHVTGETYRAVVDGEGNFSSLRVKGTEILATREEMGNREVGGGFPGDKPAESVTRDTFRLTAERDGIRVSYEFDEEGFKVFSEGGTVNWHLSRHVTACATEDGVVPIDGSDTDPDAYTPGATFQPPAAGPTILGNVHSLIAGDTGIRLSHPYNLHDRRFFPVRILRGGEERPRFSCRWTCGVDAGAVEFAGVIKLRAKGWERKRTAGYEAGERPVIQLTLRSFARARASATVLWEVYDHPHSGKKVFDKTVEVFVPANADKIVSMELPLKAPGPYWVHAAVAAGDSVLLRDKLGILYDAGGYKPPLTRPADFEQFWDRKLAEMRAIPFEAVLTEREALSTERYIGYALEINGMHGKRRKGAVLVPRAPGPHDAVVGGAGRNPGSNRKRLEKAHGQPAGVGMWEQGALRIRADWEADLRQATFTYWNGRDDNNMLDCYLHRVRVADYLRSRDDVRHLWLFGASRSGPVALVAAALAPEQVAAVNVHVPTSCGISWTDRPYRGWGRVPSNTAEGLKTAAYFDPVNFAPDMQVPVVMDGGFYDGLSPIPGMLAFCNHAVNAPFVRCSIEQGTHGYFAVSGRGEMEKALAEHLAKEGIVPKKAEALDEGAHE